MVCSRNCRYCHRYRVSQSALSSLDTDCASFPVVGIVAISIITIIILLARAVSSRRKERLEGLEPSVARGDPYQAELGDLSFSYPERAARPAFEKRESIIISETFEGNDLSYDRQGSVMQESEPLPRYERGNFVTVRNSSDLFK